MPTILDLPEELLELILSNISPYNDLKSCSLVSIVYNNSYMAWCLQCSQCMWDNLFTVLLQYVYDLLKCKI